MQPPSPTLAQLEQAAAAGHPMARIQLGNQLLIDNPAGSPDCQRGLDLLRQAAEQPQGAAAQWLLGGFYLQNLALPEGMEEAAIWIRRASESGVAPALDRLANMYLRGVGVEEDAGQAVAALGRLADAGFQRAAWERAYLKSTLDAVLDPAGSVTDFARACALGFPPAYYSLGLRFASGAGVEADPAFARALLLRAADAGLPDARAAADEVGAGPGSEEPALQWYRALKENHAAARALLGQLGGGMTIAPGKLQAVTQLEAHFAGIGHPALGLDAAGELCNQKANANVLRAEPQAWQWLCQAPRVASSAGFISREERAILMSSVAGGMLEPSRYTGKDAHGAAEIRYFNGTGMAFGALTSDSMVRAIERRIADATDWRMDAIEPCSVISYKPGQEYRSHVDYFTAAQIDDNRRRNRDHGGQRVVTFLICLQAAEAGGETSFPRVGLKVGHRECAAAMHFNSTPDGRPDEMSLHRGLPVERGEKWLLRTTLRKHGRYRP